MKFKRIETRNGERVAIFGFGLTQEMPQSKAGVEETIRRKSGLWPVEEERKALAALEAEETS